MAESARLALVTGASAGIGLETALGLARAGFRVVMAGRDAARTERARDDVAKRLAAERRDAAPVETALADFASLASVRSLAAAVLSRYDRLDVLVNNAGIIAPRYQRSQDGYELTIAVNHLAPFLLTNLLLDRLCASAAAPGASTPGARIVTCRPRRRIAARASTSDMDGPGRLDRAAGLRPFEAVQYPVHARPGAASRRDWKSSLRRCIPGSSRPRSAISAGSVIGFGWRLAKPFLASPEKGARTSLFLATTSDPTPYHGAYLIDSKPAQPDPAARDDALAERLWTESARLVGL